MLATQRRQGTKNPRITRISRIRDSIREICVIRGCFWFFSALSASAVNQLSITQAKLGKITRKTGNLADAIAEADDKGARGLLRGKLKGALDRKESLEKAPREHPTRLIDPAQRAPSALREVHPEGYPQSIWHFLAQCCTQVRLTRSRNG